MGIKSLIKSVIAPATPQTSRQEYPSESVRKADERDQQVAAAHHKARVSRARSERRWTEDEY
ncbi:MAG: hypothetical protein M9918_19525 [Anaerolineae bacterium]|nr:hypothetical protein [Anaerolineae bacterium]